MAEEDGDHSLQSQQAQESEGSGGTEQLGPYTLLKMLEGQGHRCALSGMPLTPNTMALDHRVPRSTGGEEKLSNYQFVREEINAMKGSMREDEFIRWCVQVARWYNKV
jgi:5-methylcytosine-specific restriction endonuclease McrA